jgi:translation initiation factor IF-2
MAKLRVYELAKKLGVSNKEILAELENADMAVKSHSSSLEDEQVEYITRKMTGGEDARRTPDRPRVARPRPTVRPAGIMKPSAKLKGKEVPEVPTAAKRVPPKKAAKSKASEAAKAEVAEIIASAAEVVVKAPTPAVEETPEAAAEIPEHAEEAATPAEQAPEMAASETVAEEASHPVQPAEEPVAESIPSEQEVAKPEAEVPQKIELPAQPAQEEQAAKPEISHDKKYRKKEPEPEELMLRKKPKPKGPKPTRAEAEVLEGIDRVPVIPAKLKERLQPVKKTKPGMSPQQMAAEKPSGKWKAPKGAGKKKGKMKPGAPIEIVEEIPATVARKKAIRITEGLTIKDFADKIGRKSGEVLKKLIEMGVMATINQPIDTDAATLIADTFGLKLEVTPISDQEAFVEEAEDRPEDLMPRPPVVTIMGHVDHGKTSLLDSIRQTKVTEGEAGGITQHIGAYKVRLGDKDIVFLDTPGHEAFTAMRARGAQVTDIVVLVVAADDGVKPQTVEAINHSKAAGVPIIVAVNKIDKPEADQDKVKRELADQGLVPEEWGGDTIFVPVSAKQKTGIDNLLEMILLQADVMELKANPNKLGRGTIVEAKLDKGRGPVATVLISSGTINQGDVFVTGQHFGRIRMLLNDRGKKVKSATPATPVEIIGLSGVPQSGDVFSVVEDEKVARQIAQARMQKQREIELASRKRISLDDLFSQIQQGEVKELNIIIKADVQGSVEAVSESLLKLSTEQVKLNVIHGSVGAITESDVMLASASNAIIIGFNIRPEPKASSLAESEKVDIRLYNIIYNAIDEVRAAMEGLLEPTYKEKTLGRAEVRQTFSVPKVGTIAGSYVLDGSITRNCAGVRVLRDNVVVFEGKISSLKRFKDDVKDVQTGYECGIGIQNFNDIKVGDVIEAYDIETLVSKL